MYNQHDNHEHVLHQKKALILWALVQTEEVLLIAKVGLLRPSQPSAVGDFSPQSIHVWKGTTLALSTCLPVQWLS